MSRKKNTSFLNISNNKTWNSSWCIYNQGEFRNLLQEDLILYSYVRSQFKIFDLINIINLRLYRVSNFLITDIMISFINLAARESLTAFLSSLSKFFNKCVYLAVHRPSYISIINNAFNIALKIAKLIEKRVRFRSKLVKGLIKKVKENSKGIYVQCTGRINNVDMAKVDKLFLGSVPLQSIKALIDYGFVVANTNKGLQSIKVWIYK
jgi:small subunit ribosomal protein S3